MGAKTALFVLFFCLMGAVHLHARVKFAIGEWKPFTNPGRPGQGLAAELVTEACHAAGMEPSFEYVPWRRAEEYVRSGTHFATFPYIALQDRDRFYDFSDVLFQSRFSVILNGDNPRTAGFVYRSAADYSNFVVGVVAGSDALITPLRRAGAIVEEVQTLEQNIRKLAYQRLDFVIDEMFVLQTGLKETRGEYTNVRFVFREAGYGGVNDYRVMIFRNYPRSADLKKRLNLGLKKIRENGRRDLVLKKYRWNNR